MDKIRIGKDITVTGSITVNGIAVNLEDLNIVAVATSKSDIMKEYPLELSVSGSSFTVAFRGKDMVEVSEEGDVEYKVPLGKYIITLWQNRGEMYETAWDVQAFQLVAHTFKENDDEDGLDVSHVDIGVMDFTNKFIREISEKLEEIEDAKTEFDELNKSLVEYETLFVEVKEKYENGDFKGKDLKYEDLTDEQKEELRGEPGREPKWEGAYNASHTYERGDIAESEEYVCASRKDDNQNHPLNDSEWWSVIIDKTRIKNATDKAEELNAETEAYLQNVSSAEDTRCSNEETRVANEEERMRNEEEREQAETIRAEEHTTNMSASEEATAMAKEAAEHPMYVGDDFYVYTYNVATHSYTKTGIFVRGEGFSISQTYESVYALMQDRETEDGKFYLVASDTEDEDNGKLYVKDNGRMKFIVDLSGVRGFTGKTPTLTIGNVIAGRNINNAAASVVQNSYDADGNPVYKINFTVPRFAFSDLTTEQIATFQKPAVDKANEVEIRMQTVERNATVQLAEQNVKFNSSQNNREMRFNENESTRQSTFVRNEQERQQTAAAQRAMEKAAVEKAISDTERVNAVVDGYTIVVTDRNGEEHTIDIESLVRSILNQ